MKGENEMEKKVHTIISICVALGTAVPILIGGIVFDFFPGNKYLGVFWMLFLPVALFYMQDQKTRSKKDIISMLCSYAAGLIWGYISVVLTPVLKVYGEIPFALVNYFLLMFLIMIVHQALLGKTVFNKVSCVFIAFAISIANSTTFWWSGSIDQTTFLPAPIETAWNQLDLLVVYVIGCCMLWCIETVTELFIATYMKNHTFTGQE